MISPIPRRALPHTVTLSRKTGVNSKGEPTYSTAQTVKFVRFETAKKNALTALGTQRNDEGVLYYDERNSYPAGIVFTPGDVVVFGGVTYTVREMSSEFADSASRHHQEVYLV